MTPNVTKSDRTAGSGLRKEAGKPLYVQIAARLRRKIISGAYPVGSRLPTEDKLCERFSVSRHTVREALRMLRDESLVISRKKAGTVVAEASQSDPNFLHATSIEDLMSFSTRWRFAIDQVDTATLGPELAAWVKRADDAPWLRFSGLAQIEGAPLPECWATYHVDPDYAAIGAQVRDHSGRFLTLIETMFGIAIVTLTQDISASLIPAALAEKLQVDAGSPAISVRRMYMTSTGKVAFITTETYPASRFRYTATLQRGERQR